MSERRGKIEALGLVKRIEELLTSGIVSSEAIAAALKAEGHDVSQPTVHRWLKKNKDIRREETKEIIQNHLRKTVPDDLEALEEIEAKCLEWFREPIDKLISRLAETNVTQDLHHWQTLILDAAKSPNDLVKAVAEIIKTCLRYVIRDTDLQKKRMSAAKMTAAIIETKLRYSGVIDGAGSGNIFFVDHDRDELKPNEKGQFFVVKGAKDAP
jgi:hypothetical protein